MVNIFYKNNYMKTLMKSSVFVLAAFLACTNLHAQTADDIVKKHVDAIGGKTAVESVKTLYIESDVDVAGNNAPSITWIVSGKGYKNVVEFGGSKIQQCVTDKGGWMINPMMPNGATAQPIPDEQLKTMKGQINVGGPLYEYASKGNKIELTGQDTGDYKIKLTTPAAVSVTFYLNKKTYLIDKTVSTANVQGQDMETTVIFSDYRKLDGGYVMNFGQQVTLPMYTLNITHKKVEVNKSIDPGIFDMPK
jgi:hypothetical protein